MSSGHICQLDMCCLRKICEYYYSKSDASWATEIECFFKLCGLQNSHASFAFKTDGVMLWPYPQFR